jgi:hypothetical protein
MEVEATMMCNSPCAIKFFSNLSTHINRHTSEIAAPYLEIPVPVYPLALVLLHPQLPSWPLHPFLRHTLHTIKVSKNNVTSVQQFLPIG